MLLLLRWILERSSKFTEIPCDSDSFDREAKRSLLLLTLICFISKYRLKITLGSRLVPRALTHGVAQSRP